MSGAGVEVIDEGAVRRITLDRAEKRNAMTVAMFDAVTHAVDDAVADDAVRVVVLRGAVTISVPAPRSAPRTQMPAANGRPSRVPGICNAIYARRRTG